MHAAFETLAVKQVDKRILMKEGIQALSEATPLFCTYWQFNADGAAASPRFQTELGFEVSQCDQFDEIIKYWRGLCVPVLAKWVQSLVSAEAVRKLF